MKTTRFTTLLALLLMAGRVTMQAQEQSSWLHYGSDVYGSNMAYSPQGIPFSWAVSFPPADLQSYDGFTLTRVAIYENYYIMGNLILGVYYGNEFMPLTLLDEQVFVPTGHEGFTDIVLDNPVELDITKHLWVVFSETDMTETFSAAVCYSDNPSPYARWVQMEENKWEDVAIYGPWERLQFMIWAYVTDDPWGLEEPLTPTAVCVYPNPAKEKVVIEGVEAVKVMVYNGFGQLMNTLLGTNEISVEGWSEGVYLLRVIDVDEKTFTAKVAVKR